MNRLTGIQQPDKQAMVLAGKQWNSIAKPLHSLGRLEEDIVRIAGMTGTADVRLDKRAVVVMCADHGVVSEGISQSTSEVTGIVAGAMAQGDGNINMLADCYHADVFAVDIGMRDTLPQAQYVHSIRKAKDGGVLYRKIACGTENIVQKPAMTREQAVQAIQVGISLVEELRQEGYQIIVTGEMGIGNTTVSAALAAVLLGRTAQDMTGPGAGLDQNRIAHKAGIVRQAIRKQLPEYRSQYGSGQPYHADNADAYIRLLAELGGYELAGMTGLFLGGAVYGIPIVMDGLISMVSAVLAEGIHPGVKAYMLGSHLSKEPAAAALYQMLGIEPVIRAELGLGEGTGGIMLLTLLDGALALYHSMHSFDRLCIEQYEEF